ncbi:MAG TPA: hypothetical protein VF744_07275 [Beijerinckiaceae bacterium]
MKDLSAAPIARAAAGAPRWAGPLLSLVLFTLLTSVPGWLLLSDGLRDPEVMLRGLIVGLFAPLVVAPIGFALCLILAAWRGGRSCGGAFVAGGLAALIPIVLLWPTQFLVVAAVTLLLPQLYCGAAGALSVWLARVALGALQGRSLRR